MRRLLIVMALVLGSRSPALAAVPSDTIMSSQARGFISVADAKRLEQNFNQTQMGQLVNDEAMQPFIQDMRQQIERKLSSTRQKLGITIEDLRDVATGEIGVALVEQQNARAAVCITVDVTNNVPAALALLAKIEQELLSRKATKSAANAGGVDLIVFNIPAQAKNDIAGEAIFFIHQEMLCATDSRAEAQAMIARFGGQNGGLAQVKAYQETMQRCAAEAAQTAPEVRWFIEPFGYARATRSLMSGEALAKQGKDYVNILKNQGFDAIQGVGGFVNLAVNGSFELLHRTSIYAPPVEGAEDKYKLAMRMLKLPNKTDLEPQSWIPRKLASYRTFSMDLQNAYVHFGSLFDAIAGYENAFNDVIEGLENDPYGPQVQVENDFIQHLGERITLMTDYELPITTKSERFLFALDVTNEQAVAATVRKFMEADPNAHQREFQGKVVWEIMPAQEHIEELEIAIDPIVPEGDAESPGGLGANAMSTSAVCVTDGHLLIASHMEFLERILSQQPNESLATSPDYQRVDAALDQLMPGPIAVRCFRRSEEAYRPTYELLRQGKMPQAQTLLGRLLNRLLTPPEDEEEGILRQQKIDGRQLPSFDTVRRYFNPSGLSVRSIEDGWFVVGATLSKPNPPAQADATSIRDDAQVR